MSPDAPGPERRTDDALLAARVDALAGEFVSSYMAGLTPDEIAEIFVVPVSAVDEVLRTAGAQPRPRRRFLGLVPRKQRPPKSA